MESLIPICTDFFYLLDPKATGPVTTEHAKQLLWLLARTYVPFNLFVEILKGINDLEFITMYHLVLVLMPTGDRLDCYRFWIVNEMFIYAMSIPTNVHAVNRAKQAKSKRNKYEAAAIQTPTRH